MGKYIIFGLSVLITVGLMIFVRHWSNKKAVEKSPKIKNSNIITQPKLYLYVGIAGIIVFLAIGLFFLFAPENMIVDYEDGIRLPLFFVFLSICIPYVFIILFQVNWKIEVSKNEFIFKNIWGVKRIFQFNEVKVKQLSRSTKFYHGDKRIVAISYLQENWFALEKAIMDNQNKKKKN